MEPQDGRQGNTRSETIDEKEQRELEGSIGGRSSERGEDLLQKVIDGAKNVHLAFLDRDFNFIRVNKMYARTCGYRPREMVGKNHFDLYPDDENEAIFARVRDTGEPAEFHDKPFVFPDQPERGVTYWDWTLEPIKDEHGIVTNLVFSLVETTERRRAEEKYRLLHDTMLQGVVYQDADGEIISMNPVADRILGKDPKEFIGSSSVGQELYCVHEDHSPFPGMEHPAMVALRTGQKVKDVVMGVWNPRDAEYRWISIDAVPLFRPGEEKPYQVYTTFEDITDRRRAEEALAADLRDTSILRDLSTQLISEPDNNAFYQRIIDAAVEMAKAEMGTLQVIEDGSLRIVASHGHQQPFLDFFADAELVPSAGGVSAKGIERTIVQDIGASGLFAGKPSLLVMRVAGVRAIQSTPLVSRGGLLLGILTTQWDEPHDPSERVLRRIDLLARQAADFIEHRRAEEELRGRETILRGIISNLPIVLWTLDNDGVFTLSEGRGLGRLGLRPGEVVGQSAFELYHDFPIITEATRKALSGVESSYEIDIRGTSFQSWIVPIRDERGVITGLLGVSADITERKTLEEDLKRSNDELQQFAYIASHDLREPLRMVTSYLDILGKTYEGKKLDEKAKEYIHFAVDGAERMRTMIDDLLMLSRVETQRKVLEQVDMEDVLSTVLKDLKKAIDESGSSVTSDPLPLIRADKMQMVQLLENIIGNAIKFRGEETPQINVSAREDDGMWTFSIADNGIGIDPRQEDRIFQMFQRLHSREEYEGTGIGLAISKKIVERHGGRIWFESQPGKGSTFYFTIPAGR